MEALSQSAQRRLSRRMKPEERPCYTRRTIAGTVVIEIPMPPSANKLYANARRGRVKTAAYKAWRNHAMLVESCIRPRPGRIAGPCNVTIHLPPFRGDTDNRTKPCLDAAAQAGVIADDGAAFVRDVHSIREASGTMVRMVFTMLPIKEMDRAEVEVRAREGQSVAYIAAARGLTDGQVEAILAGARP